MICSICNNLYNEEGITVRVHEDGTHPMTIGSEDDYTYYTICRRCFEKYYRRSLLYLFSMLRSEFIKACEENDPPSIKEPEE